MNNDDNDKTAHPNFKSFVPRIKSGSELYDDLYFFFQFQHHLHKIIPPCEKNDWLQRRGQNPNLFVVKFRDIDRVYKSFNLPLCICDHGFDGTKFIFSGRIRKEEGGKEDILYVYVKFVVTNDFIKKRTKTPFIVRGFIFMSDNLNLFLSCIFHTKFFGYFYDHFKKGDDDDDNFLPEEFHYYLLLQQQPQPQRSSLLLTNDDNTLQNLCLQKVRNNIKGYKSVYKIPPQIKKKMENENVIEAVKIFADSNNCNKDFIKYRNTSNCNKDFIKHHKLENCKICRYKNRELNIITNNNNNDYKCCYLLNFHTGIHELNRDKLCIEMLNFHCHHILDYQHLFKRKRIEFFDDDDDNNREKRRRRKRKIIVKDDDTTIHPRDIDQLYYIYNSYFDNNNNNNKDYCSYFEDDSDENEDDSDENDDYAIDDAIDDYDYSIFAGNNDDDGDDDKNVKTINNYYEENSDFENNHNDDDDDDHHFDRSYDYYNDFPSGCIKVLGRLSSSSPPSSEKLYFYIIAYNLFPRNFKGGIIYFSRDVNLFMKCVFNHIPNDSDKRKIEDKLLVNDGIKLSFDIDDDDDDDEDNPYLKVFHHKNLGIHDNRRDHLKLCNICFHARFSPELLNRLLYHPEDFVFHSSFLHIDIGTFHTLNIKRLRPEVLNYYCDHILDYQHLFQIKIPPHEEKGWSENNTIDIRKIDRIFNISDELYTDKDIDDELLYIKSPISRDSHKVEVSGKTIDGIYFHIIAWTMFKMGRKRTYKFGFMFLIKDVNLFIDLIVTSRYNFDECRNEIKDGKAYQLSLEKTKEVFFDKAYDTLCNYVFNHDHSKRCKICYYAQTLPNLRDRLLNSDDYEIFDKCGRFTYHHLNSKRSSRFSSLTLKAHCDDILQFQKAFKKEIMAPGDVNDDFIIHPENIDRIYYVYNKRYGIPWLINGSNCYDEDDDKIPYFRLALGRLRAMNGTYLYFCIQTKMESFSSGKILFSSNLSSLLNVIFNLQSTFQFLPHNKKNLNKNLMTHMTLHLRRENEGEAAIQSWLSKDWRRLIQIRSLLIFVGK